LPSWQGQGIFKMKSNRKKTFVLTKVGNVSEKTKSSDVGKKFSLTRPQCDQLDTQGIIMALEWAGYPAVEVVTCSTPDASCH
jgi:transcription-repair coupling factor (superfamily II helicase)